MKVIRHQTETYFLTDLDRLDPVTAYVTNYREGKGKIVIECFSDSWACFWGAIGDRTLQQFFVTCENDYILGKLLKDTHQTDFDEINEVAAKRGFPHICAESDVELADLSRDMDKCFGPDWRMDLPQCHTPEYEYLSRIVNAIKSAFSEET